MLPRHRLAPCFARFHTGPALLLVLVGLVSGVEGASRKPESAPPPGSDPWHRDDPPGNDACEQALWIQDDTVDFTTQGATTDGPPHATCQFDGQVYNDIWFRTTAPLTGLLWLTLCGSGYDTDLAVYTGWACPVDDSRLLGCNDDGCPGNGAARYRSRLALTVTQGQDLLLRVGGYGTWDRGPGELELEWEENPLGCPLAAELTGPGQFAGTTEGAWQLGSADCGYSTWSPARIVRLLPDEGGSWLASLCGSGYDTVLSVHTDCPPTAANQLACNDDACGLASEVAFDAQAGTPVYLRISGYNGDQGAFQLQLEAPAAPAPANDACDQALVIGPGFHSLSTVSATPDGPGLPGGCGDQPDPGFGGDIWFRYTAPGPGMLELDLCDADWDSRLAVYAGTSCPPSPDSLLACDDDGCGLQSRLELPVTAGHELLLRVGGYQEERGEGVLGLSFEPDCLPGGIPAPVVTLALVDSILCLGWQALEVPLEGCDPDSIGYCVWKRRQDQPWELVECTTGLVYQEDLSGVGEGVCRYRVTARRP